MTQINQTIVELAAKLLSRNDPVLATVIARAGLCTIRPHGDYYGALVNSIIGQQLSVKAAAAIKLRVWAMFDNKLPIPEQILSKTHDELRSTGLSHAKANYIQDLAEHVLDGRINFDKLGSQSNDEIITHLTDVKGVGEWTAQMFLMFSVGRTDILATGDLGVRNGIRGLYGFEDAVTPAQVMEVAEKNHWHPYESIACWYVWRSLENEP